MTASCPERLTVKEWMTAGLHWGTEARGDVDGGVMGEVDGDVDGGVM